MTSRKIDSEKVKKAVTMLLEALGDDPTRPGLIETPDRVARMYQEVFEGMNYTNDEIACMNDKMFEHVEELGEDYVLVKDIPIFSYCEHHLALMYNMTVHIAYIPKGKVIGLSKLGRIADMVSKRLQLQERIGTDISYIVQKILDSNNVLVVIDGEHSCMTARGIKKLGSSTRTVCMSGRFKNDSALRTEIFAAVSTRR